MVRGIQSKGVMSAAKHYTAFDGGTDVYVDPQTFHEIYAAPFADASRPALLPCCAPATRSMAAILCGPGATLNGVLKGESRIQGFRHTRFRRNAQHAVHQRRPRPGNARRHGRSGHGQGRILSGERPACLPPTREAAAGGRGGGAPGGMPEERGKRARRRRRGCGTRPGRAAHGNAARDRTGKVTEATIDAAVRRILTQMDRFGYLEKGTKHDVTPIDHEFNAPILQKTAEDSAVLLKNQDGVLPLQPGELADVVLIGPGAGQTIAIGLPGGKGRAFRRIKMGTVAAIEKITGKRAGSPSRTT